MNRRFPVVWLTGNTGAGKTTLAFGARAYCNENVHMSHPLARRVIVLDGDEMRATISVDEDLSPEGRRTHNLRVARLAHLLSESGYLVIVAVIAPFESVRQELQSICDPVWVYVKRSGLAGADRPYEEPQNPDLLIDNDALDIPQAQTTLLCFLEERIEMAMT